MNNKSPIIIQSDVSRNNRKITIIVDEGNVEHIIKEGCSEINVEINNYDIEKNVDNDKLYTDKYERKYFKTTFN